MPIEHLRQDPLLARCDAAVLAKLLPRIEQRDLSSGELLAEAGQPAGHLFLLVSGQLLLDRGDGRTQTVRSGYVGEEAGVGASEYLGRISAASAARVIAIPRDALVKLFAHHPELVQELHYSLTNHYSGRTLQTLPQPEAQPPSRWSELSQVVGWALAIVVPLALLWLGHALGLERDQALLLAVFAATTVM